MLIAKEWADLLTVKNGKDLDLQYDETGGEYHIWVTEGIDQYETFVQKTSPKNTDQIDFEDNHKSTANASTEPKDKFGRKFVRAEAKPLGNTACFVTQGDSATNIGDGKVLAWDFSDTNDDVASPPAGYKRKRIEFNFVDPIYVKEGTVYYHSKLKGSYLDFYVVCPDGEIYLDNNGAPQTAVGDTIISHYLMHQMMQGSVPMGDEVNTETISDQIPSSYKFWLDITVPDTDVTSNGWITIELYRTRTIIL